MKEQTLAENNEDFNEKIDKLIEEQKYLKQKIIVLLKKIDKIQEYIEIDDMRSTLTNKQLTEIKKWVIGVRH